MRLRRAALVTLAAALMLATTNVVALADVTSISIVDAPRPQPKWGFAPATRKIQPGSWVTWSNDGQDTHSVVAVDGSFDSGDLDPSEGFSWFFDQPGTYSYVCSSHPWMKGTIVVGDGGAAAALAPGADDAGNPAPPDPALP